MVKHNMKEVEHAALSCPALVSTAKRPERTRDKASYLSQHWWTSWPSTSPLADSIKGAESFHDILSRKCEERDPLLSAFLCALSIPSFLFSPSVSEELCFPKAAPFTALLGGQATSTTGESGCWYGFASPWRCAVLRFFPQQGCK